MKYLFSVLMAIPFVANASLWTPTDGDVDTILFDPNNETVGTFALTEPDDLLGGWKIPLLFGAGTFGFSADEGLFVDDTNLGWTLSNSEGASVILGDNPSFGIAYHDGVGWSEADVFTGIGEDSFLFQWSSTASPATMIVTDIAPVSEVPLPASVWLFGAGLVGMIGIARRK